MRKILLSYSTKHWTPEHNRLLGHTVSREAETWYKVASEFGEVDYIDNTDKSTVNKEYDLLISLPRNIGFLMATNKIKKSIVSLNLPEPNYLGRVMSAEAAKIGCRLSDCFRPQIPFNVDRYVMLGGEFNWNSYKEAGYPMDRFVNIKYGMDDFDFKPHIKNKRTIFLHPATTLGLRKGFWHIINDFKKADLDAELWCVGEVQRKEQFWHDFAAEAQKDPRIKVFGWIDCFDPKYKELMHKADFVVFASWGEGQPGTVMEAVACGALPIVSKESGIPFTTWNQYYQRGDISLWNKAHEMTERDYQMNQFWFQVHLEQQRYSYKYYEQVVRNTIKELC